MYPKKALMEGGNKNLIVFRNMNLKKQKFRYDHINKTWANWYSRRTASIADFAGNANVFYDGHDIGIFKYEGAKA